jgi:hypothetical protein
VTGDRRQDADPAGSLAGVAPPPPDPAATPPATEAAGPSADPSGPTAPRPWLERIGLAAVAAVMGTLFALVAVAAGAGGEWILAAMSAVGAFMTLGVGLLTLVRG